MSIEGKEQLLDKAWVKLCSENGRIPREQLAEAAQVNRKVRQFLVELAEQNPVEKPVHQQEQVSTTDPDSTYATKGGTPARLGYRVGVFKDAYAWLGEITVKRDRRVPKVSDISIAFDDDSAWISLAAPEL